MGCVVLAPSPNYLQGRLELELGHPTITVRSMLNHSVRVPFIFTRALLSSHAILTHSVTQLPIQLRAKHSYFKLVHFIIPFLSLKKRTINSLKKCTWFHIHAFVSQSSAEEQTSGLYTPYSD